MPVPKASVQSIVPYPLITPPFNDASIFPKPFPANTHPVYVSTGYQNDIRMINLQISALLSGSIYVPYTDRLKDGKTPFNYGIQNYIGGVDGREFEGVVPGRLFTCSTTPSSTKQTSLTPPSPPSHRRYSRRNTHLRRPLRPQQRRLRSHRLQPQRILSASQTNHRLQPHFRPRHHPRSIRPRLYHRQIPPLHRQNLPRPHQPTRYLEQWPLPT